MSALTDWRGAPCVVCTGLPDELRLYDVSEQCTAHTVLATVRSDLASVSADNPIVGAYVVMHKDIDAVVVQFVNTIGGTPVVHFADLGGGTKVMVANVVYNRIVRILRGQ